MGEYDECCGDCSWTKVIIGALIVAVVGGLIAVLVIAFAVVYPPKATAADAVLRRFELALAPAAGENSSTNISYDVAATLALRNPYIYRGIGYGPLAVALSFNGTRFDDAAAVVPGFDHAARKTATFNLRVGGVGKLSAAGVKEFGAQNETGKFDVELRLDTVMRYKGRSTKCPLVVVCPLELQLVDPEVAATAFQTTKCTILRAKKSGC